MSENREARLLVQESIATKRSESTKAEQERKATWRKHQRLGTKLEALKAELEGLEDALTKLGGPIEKEDEE